MLEASEPALSRGQPRVLRGGVGGEFLERTPKVMKFKGKFQDILILPSSKEVVVTLREPSEHRKISYLYSIFRESIL